MEETIDTSSQFPDRDIPDGTYTFRIEGIDRKEKGTTVMYIFKLFYEGIHTEQLLLPSMMGPLLRILGCKETEKGKFKWDKDLLTGQSFVATVVHERDKKDATKIRQQMRDFKKSDMDADVPY